MRHRGAGGVSRREQGQARPAVRHKARAHAHGGHCGVRRGRPVRDSRDARACGPRVAPAAHGGTPAGRGSGHGRGRPARRFARGVQSGDRHMRPAVRPGGRGCMGAHLQGSRACKARPVRRGRGVLQGGDQGRPRLRPGVPRDGPPADPGRPVRGGIRHVQEVDQGGPRLCVCPRCKGPRTEAGRGQGRGAVEAGLGAGRGRAPPRLGGNVGVHGMRPGLGRNGAAQVCRRVVPPGDREGSGRRCGAHGPRGLDAPSGPLQGRDRRVPCCSRDCRQDGHSGSGGEAGGAHGRRRRFRRGRRRRRPNRAQPGAGGRLHRACRRTSR